MKISFNKVGHRFESGTWGLQNIDLLLESSGFTLVCGPNGSGKSLLMRHLLGLERPTTGEISVDGTPHLQVLSEVRRRVALVMQESDHQILGVTVAEDVAFGPRQREKKLDPRLLATRVAAELERVGLSGFESRIAAFLSGGEKRRLCIASALISQPELLVLDEPFNGLDWQGASIVLTILDGLVRAGLGVLVITHDLEKCLAHADRMIVMRSGEILADSQPEKLWNAMPELGLRRIRGGVEHLKDMTWKSDFFTTTRD